MGFLLGQLYKRGFGHFVNAVAILLYDGQEKLVPQDRHLFVDVLEFQQI